MEEYYRSNYKPYSGLKIIITFGIILMLLTTVMISCIIFELIFDFEIMYLVALLFMILVFIFGYIFATQYIQDNIIINEKNIIIIKPRFIFFWKSKEILIPLETVYSFDTSIERHIIFHGKDSSIDSFVLKMKKQHYSEIDDISAIMIKIGKKRTLKYRPTYN